MNQRSHRTQLLHRGRQARGQPVVRGKEGRRRHDAKEERTYELKDVLLGRRSRPARRPLKPDKIKLVV